jgi:hypothetical protein
MKFGLEWAAIPEVARSVEIHGVGAAEENLVQHAGRAGMVTASKFSANGRATALQSVVKV